MAAIIELLLKKSISVDDIVNWIKNDVHDSPVKQLENHCKLRHEFIAFFLNYLRDKTLPLLQSSKSANPSPAKTPSAQKLKGDCNKKKSETSANRIQLFTDSPLEINTSVKSRESPVICNGSPFSPNNSFDSPGVSTPRSHMEKGNKYRGQLRNKQHSSPIGNHVDCQRSKQKISLGEFLFTPDKRVSPQSGSGKKGKQSQSSPSPSQNKSTGRRGEKILSAPTSSPLTCLSLNSLNDFPPIPDKSANLPTSRQNTKQEPSEKAIRRINPTPLKPNEVCKPQNKAFLELAQIVENKKDRNKEGSNPFTRAIGEKNSSLNLEEERELLRKEKAKKQSSVDVVKSANFLPPTTPTKSLLEKQSSLIEQLRIAEREEVTNEDKLELLAELYSKCLHGNLFPNISVELYFITQLLTIKTAADVELPLDISEDIDEVNYFTSVHNVTFFAVSVLDNQVRLLKYLDKGTLRLLAENQRIADFSPDLQLTLQDLSTSVLKNVSIITRSPIGGVSFQAETDNRKSFPNDRSFHQFKKQRDAFYECLREWEHHHLTPGWSMVDKIGERIRLMVSYNTELVNHLHFVRLFQSQLLTMCKGDNDVKDDEDSGGIALLTQLKKTNPEKFKKLQERFTTPLNHGGPCPSPTFPGCQEFFRDFIVAAASHMFNQHLTDAFAAKVSELNTQPFLSSETEEGDESKAAESDEEQKENFTSALLTLRLLGKFLGFVTFLPYQSPERLPESIQADCLSVRNKATFQLNITEHLHIALLNGRLTITVPWVIEFLSMMDSMAAQVEYVRAVLLVLLQIYRLCWKNVQLLREKNYGYLLIIVMIGWLLENPSVPEGFFFSVYSSDTKELTECEKSKTDSVDEMGLVDQQLFYTCCPYLGELKNLLVEFAMGSNRNSCTIRKITPVSADDAPVQSFSEKQLQLQLEENFFHNHVASLKKTVEFVGERTASNYIKKFRATVLPVSLTSARKQGSEFVEQTIGLSPNSKAKVKISQEIHLMASKNCDEVKELVSGEMPDYCRCKLEAILPLLLPDEQLEGVIAMATNISCRIAEEKVQQWMNKYITINMYTKEINDELDKLWKPLSPTKAVSTSIDTVCKMNTSENRTAHLESINEYRKSPSLVMIDFKDIVRDMMVHKKWASGQQVEEQLNEVRSVLNEGGDIVSGIWKGFAVLISDLAALLVIEQPDSVYEKSLHLCYELWKTHMKEYTHFENIFSICNLYKISKVKDVKHAVKRFSGFITKLIEEDLLTLKSLQMTCLQILQNSEDDLEIVADIICTVAENFKDMNKESEDVDLSECLEWLYQMAGEDSETGKRILKLLS